MNSCGKSPLIALVLVAVCAGTSSDAWAQARQALSASGSQAWKAPAAETLQCDDRAREDSNPMGPASIGMKLGAAGTGMARLPADRASATFPGAIDGRRGLRIALPIHLGGRGFGWTFEPYLSRSRIRRVARDAVGEPDGLRVFDLMAFGMYTGPTVQLQVKPPLYIGLGFGAMSSYIASDGFAFGMDLHGRVPLSLTYYLSSQIALVAELGLGYGISLFANKPRTVLDPSTRDASRVTDRAEVGQAFSWDWTFGLRLP